MIQISQDFVRYKILQNPRCWRLGEHVRVATRTYLWHVCECVKASFGIPALEVKYYFVQLKLCLFQHHLVRLPGIEPMFCMNMM